MSKKRSFAESVHDVVRQIPSGRTMSYGDVAKRAGYPGAARAVGTLLSKNFDPSIPCHRVIRADGKLGHYNRGDDMKRELLAREEREAAT